jgi:hypothetical protein
LAEASTLAPPEGTPPAAADPIMPIVPGYELLQELGRGGMGVVYKARDLRLNRAVALKMILAGLHAGLDQRARFRREAESIARLRHPNIVQIYEVGEVDGTPFFSLEYVDGGSLASQLKGTPLPSRQGALLVEALARAMHAAHQQHVVHRDLKPANVLMLSDGTPKITDFGLAKKLDDEAGATQSGAILGTPSYMAPEQAGGPRQVIGPAADVYALGAILYELLTGRPPFKAATSMDTVLQVLSEEPLPVRQLQPKTPRDLETVCAKCLQKEQAKRYPTALELAEDLHRFGELLPIKARPVGRLARAWRWCKRNPALAASLLAVAGALLVGSVVSTWFAYRADRQAGVARLAQEDAEKAAEDARAAEARAQQLAGERDHFRYDVRLNAARKSYEDGRIEAALDELERWRPAQADQADLRRFEWYHLYRKCLPADQLVLYGSDGDVNTLAWSPDGKWLASASGSGPIRLWDGQTGEQVRVFEGHRSPVNAVCFSPDGKRLASASDDDAVRIYGVSSARELLVCQGHGKGARGVAWRPPTANSSPRPRAMGKFVCGMLPRETRLRSSTAAVSPFDPSAIVRTGSNW